MANTKLANALLDKTGHVKLCDFGLARLCSHNTMSMTAGQVIDASANRSGC